MSNYLQESIESILEKARLIAKTETLIGDPITFNDMLIVPVIKVSIGFGAGSGEGSGGNDSKGGGRGGGAGGGIKIEPSCFLVHDGTSVRILHAAATKAKGMDALIEKLPDLLTYAMDSLGKRGTREQENTSNTSAKEPGEP